MRASKGPRVFEARPCDMRAIITTLHLQSAVIFFLFQLSLTISLPTFNNKTPKHPLFHPSENFHYEYFSRGQNLKINYFFSAGVPSIMFECPFSIFARTNN